MYLELESIGVIHNTRDKISDDFWGGIISEIIIDEKYPDECLDGIEEFSHIEIIFYFDRVINNKIDIGSRHPRGNPGWPKVGIFAQRGKNRPNQLGLTTVKLISREGKKLSVEGLDAIEGTPVLDIKPVIIEYQPKEKIKQPKWVSELMKDYWKK